MGMKNIFLLSILTLAILQPLAEAIFLGPVAVGVALGAIAVGKGLILGSILSQRRTSHRSGRGYTRYNRRTHYTQPRKYYQHCTQPKTYYYSSSSHHDQHDHHYGKRFAAPEPISMEELMRLKREVTDKIMTDDWYMEMVEKDQDDCTKRLICEISSRCDTPAADIVAMIENELEDFRQLEESFLNDASRAESVMEEESNEVEDMINEL